MGSEQNRFPQQHQERRKRWGACWGAFSCFGTQKGGKRIVPATRVHEGNASAAQQNGPQAAGLPNQATALAPSLLAPPSSPASFTNSALPSTAQSPSCFLSLSANSPGGPSSTMFATGPYAHETQLVSPPVFSTFTTEPSTAPLTPPPELAHLTTPSSPDVPFARFLTSSADLKTANKSNYIAANDVHSPYSLYPESPASSVRSPILMVSGDCLSSSFPEREFPPQWDPSVASQNSGHSRSGSGRVLGNDGTASPALSQDTNFFCPATFAQFYLDHNSIPHAGGRLSVSKDSDVYSNGNSGYQNRQSRSPKQDVEELEAYRASFGFSADEVVITNQYVEITDVTEDSFTMTPFPTEGPSLEEYGKRESDHVRVRAEEHHDLNQNIPHLEPQDDAPSSEERCEGQKLKRKLGNKSGASTPGSHVQTEEDNGFPRMGPSRSMKYRLGLSNSDAEVDYRRGRSLREGKGDLAWLV